MNILCFKLVILCLELGSRANHTSVRIMYHSNIRCAYVDTYFTPIRGTHF